jgi:hypothetical protein
MTRPTKFEDLDDYNQQGPMVATFNHAYFLSLPRKPLIRILKTIESMDKEVAEGLLDKQGSIETGEDLVYRLRPTEKDRERKLRNAQHTWDRCKELYEKFLTDPDSVPHYMRWNIEEWAKNENKPAIQWPDTEND